VRVGPFGGEGEVAELLLLLPAPEAAALEEAAQQQGVTLGRIVRRLVREFLDRSILPGDRLPCEEG